MLNLIKNLFYSLSTFNYLSLYAKLIIKLLFFSLFPNLLLVKLCYISNNENLNNILIWISNILFIFPSTIFCYILFNIYLVKLFKLRYKIYKNPNNIYISLLFIYIYLLKPFFDKIPFFSIPLNVFMNSIYACDFSYNFIKNDKFNNKINLFNSNCLFFLIYGFLIYISLLNVKFIYTPIFSFLINSILFHGLINYPYKNKKIKKNYFLFFEKNINFLLEPLINYINNKLEKRYIFKNT